MTKDGTGRHRETMTALATLGVGLGLALLVHAPAWPIKALGAVIALGCVAFWVLNRRRLTQSNWPD